MYCFNKPLRFTNPDGKDGWDKVLGFIAAVSDNLTLGFTQVRDRGATIASNTSDYNSGQDLGDFSSIIVGTAMIDGGSATLAGSVVVTAGTSGLSSEITIPTALAGASTVFQGASLLTQGTMNLESQKGRADGGKYENIPDSKKTGEGKNFTPAHKKRLLEANRNANGGELRSDLSGKKLDSPTQSKKGVKANMNQAEVDHVKPKSKGGTNASSNAQILSKEENLRKSNKNQ